MQREPIGIGKVGPNADFKPEASTPRHHPQHAKTVESEIEDVIGQKLSKEQAKVVREEGVVVGISREEHYNTRTYGKRRDDDLDGADVERDVQRNKDFAEAAEAVENDGGDAGGVLDALRDFFWGE